jgi:hypothetical protein
MMKRVSWFVGGVAAGAVGANYAKKKVRSTAAQMSPVVVARGAADRVRAGGRQLADAVREGRDAMRYHEDELRARRDGRLETLNEHVSPGDQVFIDGVPVESGRVIVMRERRRDGIG